MEQSFADLLSDAFSETSVPSFPEGDLDFEKLHFDEQSEKDKTDIPQEKSLTKEDEALQQEATGQTAVFSDMETEETYTAENVAKENCIDESNEEDFEGVGVKVWDKTLEEDYTSSDGEAEQEVGVSGEEEEAMETGEKPGDLLRLDRYGDELCDDNKEDRSIAEGQPLAAEGAENPQVRNKEQGESVSDEEVSYIERVPERSSKMMIKGDGIEKDEQEREEEKEEDLRDSGCEGMKIEQEESVLGVCFKQELENPCTEGPVKASLEFPEISVQNLQDLIAEVDGEECGEKMKDFSGEEHQDAGESFADYPSDFSSCENVEDGGHNQENPQSNTSADASDSGSAAEQNTGLEGAVKDVTWMERDEEGDSYLYSRDLEEEADEFRGLYVAAGGEETGNMSRDAAARGIDDEGETGESNSYTSSDDEVEEKTSDDEPLDSTRLQDLDGKEPPEETCGAHDYNTVFSADLTWNLDVLTSHTFLSEDPLTTEDAETPLSHVAPAEDVNSYSVVQREDLTTTSPSYQGSLDDSFFFNTEPEASGSAELGQLGDDEYEEERNWEQEQERIKAFYKFYNDSDGENEREGREIKVQFCADPLSQVIQYETDSSDRDSFTSSTEGEEDLSSTETSEEPRETDDTTEITPACEPPNTQLPENVPDVRNTNICTRKDKCFNMLKLTLKMALVILTGLLMFWFATDRAGWFSHVWFF